jgi:hypothetical protein
MERSSHDLFKITVPAWGIKRTRNLGSIIGSSCLIFEQKTTRIRSWGVNHSIATIENNANIMRNCEVVTIITHVDVDFERFYGDIREK